MPPRPTSEPEILRPRFGGGGGFFSDRNLDVLSHLLDDYLRIPGTQIRFGLDGIIGLIPGVGDVLGAMASWIIILAAWLRGVPRVTLARMFVNVAIETVVGTVPILGDAFDIAWKANRKNFALLERSAAALRAPRLLGHGESSDAHHMSTPHPEGRGALSALDDALARAGVGADAVDYVNLHGTATSKNDEVEAKVLPRFPARTRASSTKGFTGHTLGAAGALEAVVTLLAIEHDTVPPNLGCSEPMPEATPWLALHPAEQRIDVAVSNSFGFGGNNACLVFGRGKPA